VNTAVYRHLLGTYGRRWGYWFGFVSEIIRTLLLRVYVTVIMAQTAADIASGNLAAAKWNALYFLIAYSVGAIIGAVGELVIVGTENNQYERLMVKYYTRLIAKDMSFFRDNQTGYLVSLYRQYLDSAILLVRFIRGDAIRAFISITVPAIILTVADWRVGLVAIVIIIIQLFYMIWVSRKVNFHRTLAHEIYRQITAEVSDEITNIVAFKSGGKDEEGRTLITELAHKESQTFWGRHSLPIYFDLPRAIFTAAGVSISMYFIITGVHGSALSISLIVLTITYMFQIIRTVADIPGLMVQHDEFITKLYPTLKYLTPVYETIQDPEQPEDATKIRDGKISIENLDFSYPSQSNADKRIPVFTQLNLEIAAGEQIGVVGLSGAGKSTLTSLLMRFDEVTGGSIKIDGLDIRHVRQSDLRQRIAYVPQEPLLFHRTIMENIAYFHPNATEKEVIAAAKAAHAHDFISTFPQEYHTMVGERGIKLSGGQKQRVVIARAILKRAPIMIFDEATSALDSESEEIIQRALPEILGKQTAIIIAHRLSTVANLDRIVVMDSGKIIEEGTHQQLLVQKGRYAQLWRKQTLGE